MKKLFSLVACVILLLSCGGSLKPESEKRVSDAASSGVEEMAVPVKLTAEDFAVKVADTGSSTFKYLGDKPAIVDFYADWCVPCRLVAPILEEIAKENPDIYVYKVNIDDCPDIAKSYNVVSIPTLLFIPMDGEPMREVGLIAKKRFEKIIKEHLLE